MRGLIHIYTGDGKGKTTASIGLMVRFLSYGKKVLFVQMQKARPSGEIGFLEKNINIKIMRCTTIKKFIWKMNEEEKKEYIRQHREGFNKAINEIKNNEYDLVVFDEIIGAISQKAIIEKEVIEFLTHKEDNIEVVLTGRNASKNLIDIADYVSDIKCVKHPFKKGIISRKGVEF